MKKSQNAILNGSILIAPVEIAGYYGNLAQGFNEQGVEARLVTKHQHPFRYSNNSNEHLTITLINKLFSLSSGFRESSGFGKVRRLAFGLLGEIIWSIWSVWAIFRYSVFVFGFGQSLLRWNADLPLLRLLKKTVICNLSHGSEARPPYMNGGYQDLDSRDETGAAALRIASIRTCESVQRAEKYATHVIGSPLSTAQFATKPFINTFALGIPIETSIGPTSQIPMANTSEALHSAVRIVHAPSHRLAKGSPVIEAAIKSLQLKGLQIDFVVLSGVTNAEVLSELARCDFVVDQIYSDTPMAGLAAEAATFGKPSVVGGYGFEQLKGYIPVSMLPPSATCLPEDVELAIEALILDSDFRRRLGTDAFDFVQRQWKWDKVASRFLSIIESQVPLEWLIDPNSVIYLDGCGQSREITARQISGLINWFGTESLQLDHKPQLLEAAIRLASADTDLGNLPSEMS